MIDILTLSDGVISSIWMVADELGALAAVGAVRLTTPEGNDPTSRAQTD